MLLGVGVGICEVVPLPEFERVCVGVPETDAEPVLLRVPETVWDAEVVSWVQLDAPPAENVPAGQSVALIEERGQ